MAKVKMYDHKSFKGLINTKPASDAGDLEVATNVDVDDLNRLIRRKGHSAPVVSGDCHSLWSDGVQAYAVRNNVLVQVTPNYTTVALQIVTPGATMSYVPIAERVYASNGFETVCIENGRARSWGLAVPSSVPSAEARGGRLRAGTYQYVVTYVRKDGQESGSGRAGSVSVPAGSSILLTDVPVSSDPDVDRKVVYFSRADGSVVYRVGMIPAAQTTFLYELDVPVQVQLRTQHLGPPPAGALVDYFDGRALVAAGDTLYYSEPYAPELFDLRKNARLGAPITALVALLEGVYVATDEKLVWLGGRVPEAWTYTAVLNYGVPRGAGAKYDVSEAGVGEGTKYAAFFGTSQGLCVGNDGGTVVNLTKERFSYPSQPKGAVLMRKHRGMVQGIATFQGSEVPGNTSN